MKNPLPKSGIYQIVNRVNGRKYIGSTNNFKERKCRHFSDLKMNKHENTFLQNSYNKHGKKNFVFEILEEVDLDRLLIVEQYYLDFKIIWGVDYNINTSAFQPPMPKGQLSDEVIFEVFKLNNAGVSNLAIATQFGISRNTVSNILDRKVYLNVDVGNLKKKRLTNNKGETVKRVDCVLSDNDIKIIRCLTQYKKATYIAEYYNVTRPVIDNIKNGITYKDVEGTLPCEYIIDDINQSNFRQPTKPVLQKSLSGEPIKTWNSARDFCKENNLQKHAFNNIQSVCKGKQKQAYGFLWEYV